MNIRCHNMCHTNEILFIVVRVAQFSHDIYQTGTSLYTSKQPVAEQLK